MSQKKYYWLAFTLGTTEKELENAIRGKTWDNASKSLKKLLDSEKVRKRVEKLQ